MTFGAGCQDAKLANQFEELAVSAIEVISESKKGNHAKVKRTLDNKALFISKDAYLAAANENQDAPAFVDANGKVLPTGEIKEGTEVFINPAVKIGIAEHDLYLQ